MALPKAMAFKSQDGRYLSAAWMDGQAYLTFDSAHIKHRIVEHQTFQQSDGSLRILANSTGKFWRATPDRYIVADSDEYNSTRFYPTPIGDHLIALGIVSGENSYCTQGTAPDTVTIVLRGGGTSITQESYLVVEEIFS